MIKCKYCGSLWDGSPEDDLDIPCVACQQEMEFESHVLQEHYAICGWCGEIDLRHCMYENTLYSDKHFCDERCALMYIAYRVFGYPLIREDVEAEALGVFQDDLPF